MLVKDGLCSMKLCFYSALIRTGDLFLAISFVRASVFIVTCLCCEDFLSGSGVIC